MKRLTVFYNDNQNVVGNDSFSPSAGKPAQVLKSWRDAGFPLMVRSAFPKLSRSDLYLAHSKTYVDGVLNCEIANGFGNKLKAVAKSLRWTTASMYQAAKHAIRTGEVAASLTSGFHHASHGNGSGFCTFNGLMVTAQLLKKQGLANKVAILDLDAHYGNGTDNIIEHLNLDYIKHYTFGGDNVTPSNAEEWLIELKDIVQSFADCDVILYQAGADPHINDPLGGTLTTDQMRKRDHIVFSIAKRLGVPVAWNLAGGYQQPFRKVLEIHDNTAIECLKAYKEG